MAATEERKLTYISLFSSAGVGCLGFSLEGFQCVATSELIERRLNIQKFNGKCKYDTGYIEGDITTEAVKTKLFSEIARWRRNESVQDIDVIVATPPCQGMSVANHKKSDDEINRNSLIVESVKLVRDIAPKVFVFENVPRFLKTVCTDIDGVERAIAEVIDRNLGKKYSVYSRVINFKDFGACSSRSRTLVIGVRRDWADSFSPIELFPDAKPEVTLRECIGTMERLRDFSEFDPADFYHNFRPYAEHMRNWICNISEGQSAFDNDDLSRIPHQIIKGKRVINQNKNGDKYRRQMWDKVGPCVHTRNDQLASQNTIHPIDDRVFSIRELMRMMTVPESFRWIDFGIEELNTLPVTEKTALLKKHEINIRQSLGEAVPTAVFQSIAKNLKEYLEHKYLSDREVRAEVESRGLSDPAQTLQYVRANPLNLGFASLSRVVELANAKRNDQEAFFTNKSLATQMVQLLPETNQPTISILEPSVGAGNFLPLLLKAYSGKKSVTLTVNDIDPNAITLLKELLNYISIPTNVHIDFRCEDFLTGDFSKFDLIIGNPPFAKLPAGKQLSLYREQAKNKLAANTAAFFLEKAMAIGNYVAFVMPKFLLNTPEYSITRDIIAEKRLESIIDFGESGFTGVLIETIAIAVTTGKRPGQTIVKAIPANETRAVTQTYICDSRFPYWLIYRDKHFDALCSKMALDIFDVFRDRQLTNSVLTDNQSAIRVIKSRNISEDGAGIIDIPGYDAYIFPEYARDLAVNRFIDSDDVYLAPNMTYKPRVVRKPPNTLANGSAAILMLKEGEEHLTEAQLKFLASPEYRKFYQTARNRQTRSLNIDKNSVFFFGKLLNPEV